MSSYPGFERPQVVYVPCRSTVRRNPPLDDTRPLLLGDDGQVTSTRSLPSDTGSDLSGAAHCHTDLKIEETGVDRRARKKLVTASILCLIFTVGEAAGGILAGSLAIATDAAHMLTDFASFMISLLAIYLASRKPTKNFSFGWHRAEIIGALISVQLIWLVTGILVYMAVQRVIDDNYTIEPVTMMITAGTAVLVNILLGVTLHGVGGHGHSHGLGGHGHSHGTGDHGHSHDSASHVDSEKLIESSQYGSIVNSGSDPKLDDHSGHSMHKQPEAENINVKAAFIHVIGDVIQSVGVLIAAIIIYFKPNWKLADPICTFIFSVLVLISTINILREAFHVLMEATPRHIDFGEMKDTLMKLQGVKYVHNLRIWSLTTTRYTMSVHLAIDDISKCQTLLQEASQLIRKKYKIEDPTIQIETYSSEMEDCHHCQGPSNQ